MASNKSAVSRPYSKHRHEVGFALKAATFPKYIEGLIIVATLVFVIVPVALATPFMFMAGRVAVHAILQLHGIQLWVLPSDSRFLMFMATITSICFWIIRLVVAGCTFGSPAPVAVIKRKRMLEGNVLPCRRRVTLSALGSKFPFVNLWLRMTRCTGLRGSFENAVHVASFAIRDLVLAREPEGGQIMVEIPGERCYHTTGVFPSARRMAKRAVGAEFSLMYLRLRMTSRAGLGCSSESIFQVTFLATDRSMFARQRKTGGIVGKAAREGRLSRRKYPCTGRMALCAVGAEPSLMDLRLGMTTGTGLRRTPKCIL